MSGHGPAAGSRPTVKTELTSARPTQTTVRFSGECPGPQESTADHLSRPDDSIGHLGVQDRLYVSTTVVRTVLATGISIWRSDLPLSRQGVTLARSCSIANLPSIRWHQDS
jgi:hypothetical protein